MTILLALATLVATPATLPAVAAQAKGGDMVNLSRGTYGPITLRLKYSARVTFNAGGATVRGLVVNGANIRWRSGTLAAPGGKDGVAGAGYAVLVRGASNIRFDGVLVTDAKKGIVVDGTKDLTVADSRFLRLREDGIIASKMSGLTVVRNRFADMDPLPSTCVAGAITIQKVAKRACDSRGGTWRDGNHPDAVQMWNGVTDALIVGNVVEGMTQGLTQMGSGLPLERIRIEGNRVTADAHHITLATSCIDCVIRGNVVRRWPASTYRAAIRPGAARRCGNDVQDEKSDVAC